MTCGDVDGSDVFGAGCLAAGVSPVFAAGFVGVGNRQAACAGGQGGQTPQL